MSLIDKFLDAIKLNDDFDEDGNLTILSRMMITSRTKMKNRPRKQPKNL